MIAEAPAGKTILVVEDNAVTREGLVTILSDAGYKTIPAENGQKALELLQNGPAPDLILLDMLMPVLDGWHFIGQVQRAGESRPLAIVVVTGTILSREWAESHGCAGFLHKPIEPEPLLEEVRRCLIGNMVSL
jgi:CheY-like chemotaxis protein